MAFLGLMTNLVLGQTTFNYSVHLDPVNLPGFNGLHSYAFAQSNGLWLVIGGRTDGLHHRQPFASFPSSSNNTDIYVIDVENQQFWTASVNNLSTGLKEQLQATNMNFLQEEDTLYIIGGYAYSASHNDHITFPNLTTVSVSGLMNAIISGGSITPYFKQTSDPLFAVTGGHLAKLGNTFLLVGGHRFDGRYNPMGHATYVQTYTHAVRRFKINNQGAQLSFVPEPAFTDAVHLRRRDYNLLPWIYPNGEAGFLLSSGVFQATVDLPFLYPVEIHDYGYLPVTGFSQYLNHYHTAFAPMYDAVTNEMHTLFFGGMSQYYYLNGTLIQDNQVPFVKTISRLSRTSSGVLEEYQLPEEMPGLEGASAEFIPNPSLTDSLGVIHLNTADTLEIGHILGGLYSTMLNPFSVNMTSGTSASTTIYKVTLIKGQPAGVTRLNGGNPYDALVSPNPASGTLNLTFNLAKPVNVRYFITDTSGRITQQGQIPSVQPGENTFTLEFPRLSGQTLTVNLVFDNRYYVSKKVVAE